MGFKSYDANFIVFTSLVAPIAFDSYIKCFIYVFSRLPTMVITLCCNVTLPTQNATFVQNYCGALGLKDSNVLVRLGI